MLIFRENYPEMRATLRWAARPESASHRHEIEPWVARWMEAIAKYCKLSS
ncbi:MAG: hypothetical protein GY946_29760 [bacterium]|nr:hypothetical protein [bacterium]